MDARASSAWPPGCFLSPVICHHRRRHRRRRHHHYHNRNHLPHCTQEYEAKQGSKGFTKTQLRQGYDICKAQGYMVGALGQGGAGQRGAV